MRLSPWSPAESADPAGRSSRSPRPVPVRSRRPIPRTSRLRTASSPTWRRATASTAGHWSAARFLWRLKLSRLLTARRVPQLSDREVLDVQALNMGANRRPLRDHDRAFPDSSIATNSPTTPICTSCGVEQECWCRTEGNCGGVVVAAGARLTAPAGAKHPSLVSVPQLMGHETLEVVRARWVRC
jgi:hypothetical protein